MKHSMKLAVVGAALVCGAMPASAADLYEPEVIEYKDPAPAHGGWYLRGYIGMTNQRYRGLDYFRFDLPANDVQWQERGHFGVSPLFGVGVGYQVTHWLRGELTAEYRAKSTFRALDHVYSTADGSLTSINAYRAKKSEWLFLANAYADLGKFHGITPYVGAGIGAARVTISNFVDNNLLSGGGGYAGSDPQWNLAWALHAGFAYDVTDRATVDFGYSFVHLGKGKTARAYNMAGGGDPNDGFKFRDITSHDLKLGVRYKLY